MILILGSSILILLALCFQVPGFQFVLLRINPSSMLEPVPFPLSERLTPTERLLLGDPSQSKLTQKELLFLSDPNNPAYYVEYVSAYVANHGQLPRDYFETTARIDPENSFFLYFAAAHIGKDAISRGSSGGASKSDSRLVGGARPPPESRNPIYLISDEELVIDALRLVSQARSLKKFNSYGHIMRSERLRVLGTISPADWVSMNTDVYGDLTSVIKIRALMDIISARAQQLSEVGDREGFIDLVKSRSHLLRCLTRNPDVSLVSELVTVAVASGTSRSFHAAAVRLDLPEVAGAFEAQNAGFEVEQKRRHLAGRSQTNTTLTRRGSAFGFLPLLVKQVASPPPIALSDLAPRRHAEHDLAFRFCLTFVGVIILLLGLLVSLFRFHSPAQVRIPAKRLALLLRRSDWAWIIFCGVFLPLMLIIAINRLTPLGGRDVSLFYVHTRFLLFHPGAILLSLLLAPAALVRWRLAKRLAPFGLDLSTGRVPVVLLALLLLWVLAARPILEQAEAAKPVLIGLLIVPTIYVLYFGVISLAAIAGKSTKRMPRLVTSVALAPAYASAVLAICLVLPFLSLSERHWVARDTLMGFSPSTAGLGRYEYEVALQRRLETSCILGLAE